MNPVVLLTIVLCFHYSYADNGPVNKTDEANPVKNNVQTVSVTSAPPSCICSVFLSGQVTKGKPPKGNPALVNELDDQVNCGPLGVKQCTTKCLEVLVKHLPNSPGLICGSIDRDCFKEKATLFVKNCNGQWTSTNLSAGREYCCKDSLPYKCPSN